MKNKKGTLLMVFLFAATLIAATLGYRYFSKIYTPPIQEQPTVPAPMAAPDFTVKNQEGEMVDLSDSFGKPIVVNFWATWCDPCKAELPSFQAAYDAYGQDVTFLMVNLVDNYVEFEDDVRAFVEEEGYTLPVYYDVDFSAVDAYDPPGTPATVFIDARGNVVDAVTGALSFPALEAFLQKHGFIDAPQ